MREEGEDERRVATGTAMDIPAVLRLPDCRMKTLCQPLLVNVKSHYKTLTNSCKSLSYMRQCIIHFILGGGREGERERERGVVTLTPFVAYE